MKKNIYCLLLWLLFISCSSHIEDSLSNHAIHHFAKEMKKSHELYLYGMGGAIPDRIKLFSMDFYGSKKLTLEEARVEFVTIAEKFLEQVNSDQKIRSYLEDYPVTVANLDLDIKLKENDLNPSPYIAAMFTDSFGAFRFEDVQEISIHYQIDDPNCPGFKTIYIETYEEAKRIVFSKLGKDK